MRRTMLRSLALTIFVILPVMAASVRAQEASPPAAGEAIELPIDLPAAPAGVAVLRVTLEPGELSPLHPHPELEFTFVVAGSATLRIAAGPAVRGVRGEDEAGVTPEAAGPGSELTVVAGDVVIVPPGAVFEARAGNEGGTVIIVGFASMAGEGTPAA